MSVPVKLTEKVSVYRKKMGANTIVSMTFEMKTPDAERAQFLRDALSEAFIVSIRKTDEELMR